jgi:hypothetical protein
MLAGAGALGAGTSGVGGVLGGPLGAAVTARAAGTFLAAARTVGTCTGTFGATVPT